MRIRFKLLLGFVSVAALVVLVGFLSDRTGGGLRNRLNDLGGTTVPELSNVHEMQSAITSAHRSAWQMLAVAGDDDGRKEQAALHRQAHLRLDAFEQSLARSRVAAAAQVETATREGDERLAASEADKLASRLLPLSEQFADHRRRLERVLALASKDPQAARTLMQADVVPQYDSEILPLLHAHESAAQRALTREVRGIQRDLAETDERKNWTSLIALLGAVLYGSLVAQSIGRPLVELTRAANRVGKGELTTRIPVRSSDEIGQLAATFNEMTVRLDASTVSRQYVDSILHSMREMLIVLDEDLRIRSVNYAVTNALGYEEKELCGRRLSELLSSFSPTDGDLRSAIMRGVECSITTSAGGTIPIYCSASPLHGADSGSGLVCVAQDITERKLAEQKLRASLHEKEILLKEIHHRVKNNLQVISSLLSLQASERQDPETAALFQESQARIRAMALIHEQLCEADDLARIQFDEYMQRLAAQLVRTASRHGVQIRIDVKPVSLPLGRAISCGMIVNELVSNSLKHAFPDNRTGEVSVSLEVHEDRHVLEVRDNGIGLVGSPEETGPRSLGLRIVQALVDQLGGTWTASHDGGARFVVTFFEPSGPSSENSRESAFAVEHP